MLATINAVESVQLTALLKKYMSQMKTMQIFAKQI